MVCQVLNKHIVSEAKSHTRLSDYLIGVFEEIPTRKGIKKAIEDNRVLVDGVVSKTSHYVQKGEEICLLEKEVSPGRKYNLEVPVVYEDDYFAVVEKPSGIPVSGNYFKTLFNALDGNLYISSQKDRLPQFLPVHRLDSATSGLVIIAKTHSVRVAFGNMLHEKQIIKRYRAILQGTLSGSGMVNSLVDDKDALSEYQVLENIETVNDTTLTLVDLFPLTGRTHQLRIHMSSIGHPIVGDKLYRGDTAMKTNKGLFLAAIGLEFLHPVTRQLLKIEIFPPAKFFTYLEREKKRRQKYT